MTFIETQLFPQRKNSEEEILQRDRPSIGPEILDRFSTGVNMTALAYAVSQVLSTSEVPTIEFENRGGFNTLYKFGFQGGKKVIARDCMDSLQKFAGQVLC